MGTLARIKRQVRAGRFHLTKHAQDEREHDHLTNDDIKVAILRGKSIKTYTRDWRGPRHEIVGTARDGRPVHILCRILSSGIVRVITVWESKDQDG